MGRASRKEDLNTSIKANAEMSQPNEQANS
jgi:hypothetical protein